MFRERLWTYSLVTGVTLLIWFWAATETRDEGTASFRIELVGAADQVVTPSELTVHVKMEGSSLALERALQAAQLSIKLTVGNELPSQTGVQRVKVLEALERNETIAGTGVSLLSVDPIDLDIAIDNLVTATLPIEPVLPGVELDGTVTVDPPQVQVRLPRRIRDRAGSDLRVTANVLGQRLDRLKPGVLNTITASLELPPRFAEDPTVTLDRSFAEITFTVKSRIKQTTLPTVRVQIAGPPEDHEEYFIEIENPTLANVTIKADLELIGRIERNQAVVVAIVHLSQREKERGIKEKPVTCFMAIPRDGNAAFRAAIVSAEIEGDTQAPVIRLKISDRTAKPPA
ncbi:MAG: hypothetical protein E2O40_06630 [Planctomycetota bacterium]|nr:MAG: hypothetical protein E2O40_06630 [Planctomycetota bacterium]